MIRVSSAALVAAAAIGLSACSSTETTDYLTQCGAPTVTEGDPPRSVVRYHPEHMDCARNMAAQAERENSRRTQMALGALAVGLAAGSAGYMAGYNSRPQPVYYQPPRVVNCHRVGSNWVQCQ